MQSASAVHKVTVFQASPATDVTIVAWSRKETAHVEQNTVPRNIETCVFLAFVFRSACISAAVAGRNKK